MDWCSCPQRGNGSVCRFWSLSASKRSGRTCVQLISSPAASLLVGILAGSFARPYGGRRSSLPPRLQTPRRSQINRRRPYACRDVWHSPSQLKVASSVGASLLRPETVDFWFDPRTLKPVAVSFWQRPCTPIVEWLSVASFGYLRCGFAPTMQYSTPAPRAFDDRWRERLHLAIKVLRDVQDVWLNSSLPFPSQSAAAVVFQIFAFDFYAAGFVGYRGVPPAELWRRSITEWFSSVSEAASECARLSPAADRQSCKVMAERVYEIFDSAAESWEKLSPLEPSCEVVVRQVFDLLVANRFAHA